MGPSQPPPQAYPSLSPPLPGLHKMGGKERMSFYLMERGWQSSQMFGNAAYDERGAWIMMIEEARWEDTVISINGQPVTIRRGQLYASVRFMAKKFKWSTNRVLRFLVKLKSWGAITVQTETGQNLITICNYSKYQRNENTSEDASGDTGGDKIERNTNKCKQVKQKKDAQPDFKIPDWMPNTEWSGYLEYRKVKKAPATPRAIVLLIAELDRLRQAGNDPAMVLNQSVVRNWVGIFAIGGDNGNRQGYQQQPEKKSRSQKMDEAAAQGVADARRRRMEGTYEF